jgi:lipase ATG15
MGACNDGHHHVVWQGMPLRTNASLKKCVYDTVGDSGWRLSIANHRINTVIEDVFGEIQQRSRLLV